MSYRTIAAILACISVIAGCSSPAPAPTTAEPTSVPEPHESEFPSHWDEEPDMPITADSDLTPQELTAALRVQATAQQHPEHCTPEEVSIELQAIDAALGHRFGSLTVTNTSTTPCTVQGYPGFGARGEWGNTFLLVAEQENINGSPTDGPPPAAGPDNAADQPLITLSPGDSAYADVEWSGELGGAASEPISLFIIQLVDGETPYALPVISQYSERAAEHPSVNGVMEPNTGLDISFSTTVSIGRFQQ